jgi:hypothetical protein
LGLFAISVTSHWRIRGGNYHFCTTAGIAYLGTALISAGSEVNVMKKEMLVSVIAEVHFWAELKSKFSPLSNKLLKLSQPGCHDIP